MKRILLFGLLLVSLVGAETILVEGAMASRDVTVKAGDSVKVDGAMCRVNIQGQGDVLHLTGAQNQVELGAPMNGVVITGSSNQLVIKGTLKQLDIRGATNQIVLDGNCDLIQFGGSNNQVKWVERPGRKQPKVERTGVNNQLTVTKP